jgi:glycosyltransferase involved in cell wall biosynthesis
VSAGRPPVAVVHDYVTQRGGAERVVLAMLRSFPDAELHTSVYDPASSFPEFNWHRVRRTPLDRVPLFRREHRTAFPVLAPAFSRLRVDADVVLCSSSGWAHGARTDGRKVVYCHSPAKWLYDPDRYFGTSGGAGRAVARALGPSLRRWDRAAERSASRYLVNSTMVRDWVRDVYGRDAEVLHPPHGATPGAPERPVEGVEPGFLLCVSRLLRYKHVDVVLDAARALPGERVVVVGTGPEERTLRAAAPPSTVFTGRIDDAQLRWLYRHCDGLVASSHEDFGLTPLEAAAYGKPVAALRWGGFLDTVVEGTTGVLFDHPTATDVALALQVLRTTTWSPRVLEAHAATFGEERFSERLREVVSQELQ